MKHLQKSLEYSLNKMVCQNQLLYSFTGTLSLSTMLKTWERIILRDVPYSTLLTVSDT